MDQLTPMNKPSVLFLAASLLATFAAPTFTLAAAEPPPIPVGLDAYRQWDHWAYQRIGMRAYMRSTYDRSGGNDDPSHFLYQLADDNNVSLDVQGEGILCFARYNHWHGSPWHYVVDGTEHLIQETSTADPTKPARNSAFLPEKIFTEPLAYTWAATKGADLIWTPIGFEHSFRMGYSRTHYGTGYYIYDQFVKGTPLSQPIKAWNGEAPPDNGAVEILKSAGTDIAPSTGLTKADGEVVLGKDATVVLPKIVPPGPSMLRALEFSAPREQAVALGKAKLRVTWDDEAHPSIDAPLALFFGAGYLLQSRRARIPGEVAARDGSFRRRCGASGLLFSHAVLSFGQDRAGRQRRARPHGDQMERALRAIPRFADVRRVFPCHLPRPSSPGTGQGHGAARHPRNGRRR